MDEKQKTIVIASAFIIFFVIAAFAISQGKEKITGQVVREDCDIECISNSDCDDLNEKTSDGCAYPGSCASRCIHEIIKD